MSVADWSNSRGLCGVCGKVNFASKKLARTGLRQLLYRSEEGRRDDRGNPLRVYLACDQNSFHIGHASARRGPNLNEPLLRWVEG